MNGKYACVILAGGKGSRMGGINKARLRYKGASFYSRIGAELEKTGLPIYISVATYDQSVHDGWVIVKDIVKDENGSYIGPLGGIYSCLVKAGEEGLEGLFFAPCDAPNYDSSIIRKLAEHIDDETDAVIFSNSEGRLQTVFG